MACAYCKQHPHAYGCPLRRPADEHKPLPASDDPRPLHHALRRAGVYVLAVLAQDVEALRELCGLYGVRGEEG